MDAKNVEIWTTPTLTLRSGAILRRSILRDRGPLTLRSLLPEKEASRRPELTPCPKPLTSCTWSHTHFFSHSDRKRYRRMSKESANSLLGIFTSTVRGFLSTSKRPKSHFQNPLFSQTKMVMRPISDAVAEKAAASIHPNRDPNTLSNYNAWKTQHTTANYEIDFDNKCLHGSVTLTLKKLAGERNIILDTSYLDVSAVTIAGKKVNWELAAKRTEPYGSPLTISLSEEDVASASELSVNIEVSTTKDCTALQWMTPAQTSNKKQPYMFSQCQAIHARSLLPCQDTPDVKSTYTFNLRSPLPVVASGLPTGAKDFKAGKEGESGTLLYSFHQEVPMPSYLFAIASGDLASASIGPRSTVWTGPEELTDCQWEFEADTEAYIQTAEKIVYPYAWTMYNVLVLPPSFPYG
jgi:leukotriene-A4 hydrolase